MRRFRLMMEDPCNTQDAKEQLRGKDLACWCSENAACHADILLEIANAL
jgi:hypothetical protein